MKFKLKLIKNFAGAIMNRNAIIIILIVLIIAVWGVLAFTHFGTGQQGTEITFLSNSTIKNGDNVEFELKDVQGNPISGEQLTILYDDGNKTENYSVVTDGNGKGYLTLSNEDPGNHSVIVKYDGNDKYGPCSANTVITIEDDTPEETTTSQSSYSTQSTSQSSSSSSSGDSVHYDEKYNVYYNDQGVVVSGSNKGSSVESVRSSASDHAKDFE